MRLNADFNERVVIRPEDYQWVDSPMPGVERMMLDRIGGEEFFVLEGEFGDEHYVYPVGSYVKVGHLVD